MGYQFSYKWEPFTMAWYSQRIMFDASSGVALATISYQWFAGRVIAVKNVVGDHEVSESTTFPALTNLLKNIVTTTT